LKHRADQIFKGEGRSIFFPLNYLAIRTKNTTERQKHDWKHDMASLHFPLPVVKPVIFLVTLICLLYSNTLNAPWHFDDYQNITHNKNVQITVLDINNIKKSIFESPSGDSLNRPFSYLSFTLNWLWGKDKVTGYHVVNIAIHVVSSLFLYLVILQLLQTPNAGRWDKDSLFFIALLSTVLWAIHPIQTQAVTYIVQRMASMAAMFYLIGIFCYLKARMLSFRTSRIIFWGLCFIAFLLGVGSKNNAILLPASLILIEFLFFQNLSLKTVQKRAGVIFLISILLIGVTGVLLFMENGLNQLFDGYEKRPFTMLERVLTQPIILLFYLSQIFYPVAHRFSITHDVTYATSLFQPWYTFFAIAVIILLLGIAIWRIRKNPFLSFAILFYFGNHVIESSILPLEMVFEHRNYLPSFFLFIPVAIGIKKMLDHYKCIRKTTYYFIVCFVCALIMGIGVSTYIRNWDWRSVRSLWQDAAEKAPQSARPLHNLAWGYYEPTGQYEIAIDLYHKALNLKINRLNSKATAYNNLASIHYSKFKDYDKAIDYARKALDIMPEYTISHLILCNSLAMLSQYEKALIQLDQILETNPNVSKVHYLKGFILMKTNQLEKALPFFQESIRLSPNDWKYIRDVGVCLTLMGHHERGFWFLNRSLASNPRQVSTLLAMADNQLRTGSHEDASNYISKLVGLTGIYQLETLFDNIEKDPLGLPLDLNNLKKLTAAHIQDLTNSYEQAATRMILQSEQGM
jgi:protein O-mannosyl-transferase